MTREELRVGPPSPFHIHKDACAECCSAFEAWLLKPDFDELKKGLCPVGLPLFIELMSK